MSDVKFKTMRHIETVRNYLNGCVKELLNRAEWHDQTKLDAPEADIFEIYTPKLKATTYGSDEYKKHLKEMNVALDHHYRFNRHHPEFYAEGIKAMSLFDILEMLCDWKAATMRHADGDIRKSIEMNQKRFGYSDELKRIFKNTIEEIEDFKIDHHADES